MRSDGKLKWKWLLNIYIIKQLTFVYMFPIAGQTAGHSWVACGWYRLKAKKVKIPIFSASHGKLECYKITKRG